MSQPKSGFEIRADLLNQAQGLLEGNIYRSNEAVVEHNNNFPNDRKPYGDQFVSTEEVIAVARGREEFGARALGNRSILCLPTELNISKLNNIKKRINDKNLFFNI